jgi:hypothetical protein
MVAHFNGTVVLTLTFHFIRPLIATANISAPAFSRILRGMIIITAIDKPVERVGKGSPARQATLKLYESEIESTYQNFGGRGLVEPIARAEVADILPWLERHASCLSAKPNLQLDVDRDLFELGFDR